MQQQNAKGGKTNKHESAEGQQKEDPNMRLGFIYKMRGFKPMDWLIYLKISIFLGKVYESPFSCNKTKILNLTWGRLKIVRNGLKNVTISEEDGPIMTYGLHKLSDLFTKKM